MLSDSTRQKIDRLIAQYPVPRSALIPSLHAVQAETGYLTKEAVAEVADIFHLSPNEVWEVASFYTMFYKKPVGRYVLQVCTNISCMLCDSAEILQHLQKRLRIKTGETTPDGKFTLLEVECLASCGTSPVVQINDDYLENLTTEKIDKILDGLA
jgi:NADH-quinone oxidoreductase E subunit